MQEKIKEQRKGSEKGEVLIVQIPVVVGLDLRAIEIDPTINS